MPVRTQRLLSAALVGSTLWSGSVAAQAPRATLSQGTQAVVQATTTRITGIAVTTDEPPKPVTGLRVRLRTPSGQTVATTDLNSRGEFSFDVEPGTYYVELLDRENRVVAVEDVGETAITVTRGRVSTTVLRLTSRRLPGGAWGPGAWAIIGAAAAGGVAAVAAIGPPASPEQ